MRIKDGETIVVWFSCGAASAVAAKMTVEKYGMTNPIRIVNNPIKEESTDNRRFLKDVETWIGRKIEICVNSKYPDTSCETVWKDRKYMSGPTGAPCTMLLKKAARQQWEKDNHFDWIVMGFTSEEKARHQMFTLTERANVLPILIDMNISKSDCFTTVISAGILLPDTYYRGYPNANCLGCVKVTSPTYWNHLRVESPEIFKSRADLSRNIGAKLVRHKGKRIFLDELPPDAKGRPMKNLNTECGIFCEEYKK